MKREDYTPFHLDGRQMVVPGPKALEVEQEFGLEGWSRPMRQHQARKIIDALIASGEVYSTGGSLWVYILWCRQHNRPFTLQRGEPGFGFGLKLEHRPADHRCPGCQKPSAHALTSPTGKCRQCEGGAQ